MSARVPAFPPDVARALQEREGEVSFRYTLSERLELPLPWDKALMETPYERVLAALVLDTKLNLRFVRTGSREEGARVVMTRVDHLMDARHWVVTLWWDPDSMRVSVREQDGQRSAASPRS
jgi:hypothetical protein